MRRSSCFCGSGTSWWHSCQQYLCFTGSSSHFSLDRYKSPGSCTTSNFPFQHMKFIRKYLRATDLATDRQSVKKFVHKFLGYDGVRVFLSNVFRVTNLIKVFCMRMISAHAGDILATELIVALWHNFNDRVRKVSHFGLVEFWFGLSFSINFWLN